MKKIDYRFKLVYAFGMIFIVSGHAFGGGIESLTHFFVPLYSFHVAFFVFASGYFYSRKSENHVGSYLWKKVKTLMIPLFIWHFIYGLIVYFLHRHGFTIGDDISFYTLFINPLTNGHAFNFDLAGWFVAPLFYIQVVNVLFRKLLGLINKNINEWVFFGIYLGLGMFGVYLVSKGYNQNYWLPLVRSLYLLPFFALGTLYKERLEKYDRIPNVLYFAILFIGKALVVRHYGEVPTVSAAFPADFNNLLTPFLIPLLGIAFWFRVCKILEPALGNSRLTRLIGDHTYPIMIHHLFGFFIFKTILALIAKYTSHLQDFNFVLYKSDVWYCYAGSNLYKMMDVVAGIAFPLVLYFLYSRAWIFIKEKFFKDNTTKIKTQ